jgi:hypothetical protein
MRDTVAALSRGWLPIGIDIDPDAPFFGTGSVRWMEVGSDPLRDPFLYDTAKRHRSASPPAREIDTTLDVFLALAGELPPVAPAGCIFHVSRCGSTLIANALKTVSDVVVVSEPPHVAQLLLPVCREPGAFASAKWERTRDTLVKSLLRFFAHYRADAPEKVIVKFPSINILHMKIVRRLWPETPFLIVVRDPVEVVVANLAAGIWMDLKASAARSRQVLGWDGSAMNDAEYCARALNTYQTAAIEALDERCMIVDYAQLNSPKMQQIASFFGQKIETIADIDKVFRRYSKSLDGLAPFREDSLAKQRLADHVVRAAALHWARNSYNELKRRSLLPLLADAIAPH